MKTFDKILDEKIRTGSYQYKIFGVVSLLDFCDGIEYAFMSILLSILKTEWGLDNSQVTILGSIYFVGATIGNYICAYIADTIGRKTTLIIFSGFSFVALLYTSIVTSYIEILFVRLAFGAVLGITQPLAYIYISEIVVQKYRGRFGAALTVMFVLGKIYLIVLCFIFLEDFTKGNWRSLLRFNSIPVGLVFIGTMIFLEETIRFELHQGKYKEAFTQIDRAIISNGNDELITDQDKDGLIQWTSKLIKNESRESVQFTGLFSKHYLRYTIRLWVIYIGANLQNLTIFLLLPFLLESAGQGFKSMLYVFLTELVTSFALYLFIDNEKFGGRVNVILIAGVLSTFSNSYLYFRKEKFLLEGMLLLKICNRALFSTTNILACESYASNYRSMGVGYAVGVGRLSGVIGPYILFPLYFIEPYLPFLFIAIIQFILLVTVLIIREDKTQKPLE